MDWYNVKSKLPEPFVSVLCHIPINKPCPTIHEGFVDDADCWWIFNEGASGKVTYWADMPEYPDPDLPNRA